MPLHVTAFQPDWKMLDKPSTAPATLLEARRIARAAGLRYVYTGNIHAEPTQSTYCHACGALLIGRNWHTITAWRLAEAGVARAVAPLAPVCSRVGPALGNGAGSRWL